MIPPYQSKPAKTPTYRERKLAGQVKERPRKGLRKVAKGNSARMVKYAKWRDEILMIARPCANCRRYVPLELHHPSGRNGDHLFEAIALCRGCHMLIHQMPDAAYAAGWLTPAYRGYASNPNHPQPFTLLPR